MTEQMEVPEATNTIKARVKQSQMDFRLIGMIVFFSVAAVWGAQQILFFGGEKDAPVVQAQSVDEVPQNESSIDMEILLDAVDARFETLVQLAANENRVSEPVIEYVEVPVEGPPVYIELPGETRYINVPGPPVEVEVERIVEVEVPVIEYVRDMPVPGRDTIYICIHAVDATALRLESSQREYGLPGGECVEVVAQGHYTEYTLIVTR